MKLVAKRRRTLAYFALPCILTVWFASAQDVAHLNSTDLEVVRMGHFKAKGDTLTLYRLYKAPDGTKGQVHSTEFDSLEPAELQIEKWIKATRTIQSREHNQTNGNQLISDRILAIADLPKSDTKEFVIIRRDYLKCYFIESVSLQVALQVEGLLDGK